MESSVTKAKKTSLRGNFFFLVIYKAILVLAPLIVSPYVSRVLGADLIGDYSYYTTIIGFFTLVAEFGFNDYASRQISKMRDNKEKYSSTFYGVLFSKMLLGVPITILYFILVFSGVFGKDNITVYCILFLQILAVFIDPFFLFIGLEKFKQISIRTTILKIVLICTVYLFVKSKEDFLNYVIIYSMMTIGSPLVIWLFVPKLVTKPHFKEIQLFEHFKKAVSFFVPILSITIYGLIDKAMIRWITQASDENGYYEQATKMTTLITNCLGALDYLMLSRISYLYEIKDEKEIKSKTQKAFKTFFLLSLPCFFGLILLDYIFVPTFFGDGYEKTIYILYAISPIVIFQSLRTLLQSLYYIPNNKLKVSNTIIVSGTIFNILVNIPLIYFFKSIGAGICLTLSEFLILSLMLYFARDRLKIKDILKESIKPLIGSLIMFIIGLGVMLGLLYLLKGVQHNYLYICIIVFIVAIIVYFVVEILLKEEMTVSTLRIIFNKLKKIRKTDSIKNEKEVNTETKEEKTEDKEDKTK